VIAFIILLQIGFEVFDWPNWIEVWIQKAFYVLMALSITYMIMRIIDLLVAQWKARASSKVDKAFNDQLFPILSKGLKGFVLVIAFLLTVQHLGLNITSLIASLSVVGLALGLAAQDTAANVFGAVAVFVDKPFKIGDTIKLENVEGTVEAMGLRSTRVRNPDGHLITIPNKTMGNATIVNITRRATIKQVMTFGVTYDTTAEKLSEAIRILENVFKTHPMTHDVWITFKQFADNSLNIEVTYWWKDTDHKAFLHGLQEMNLEIKRKFDEAKIGFAFPSRTLYLKQDSDLVIQVQPTAANDLQAGNARQE
jgi:MscS family membrane protein